MTEITILLLRVVLSGQVSTRFDFDTQASELLVNRGSFEASCLHAAGHVIDDADIRAREPEYEK
jgi:hypothetical protein